ncbi:4-hydroxythreonine-4-phosphate dehydrogenase PdxA [Arthrobacter sp. PL16]|uniref:4-hydroxythreonine-4-phosphate dehydrogenase PdxA n=1 Tax=Arthrobacter sp. PL16 TaxID=3071720 RepID=UPI002E105058
MPHAAWGCCSANRTGSRYGPQELELPESQQRVVVSAFTKALGNPDEPTGLAGLNPLAGENRLFRNDDADILAPAVAAARENVINVHGPISRRRAHPRCGQGQVEHGHRLLPRSGHAPFEAVYGDDGVNITVGLPVVRVSVDHGTAFDIAGQGIARETSLVLSMRRAAALAPGWDHVWRTAQKK